MFIKEDLVAEVTIYSEFKDCIESRRSDKAEKYLKQHGWKELASGCGKGNIQNIEYRGYLRCQKHFQNFADMQNELNDIELAFHDRKTIIPSNDKHARTWDSINN